MPLLTLTLTLTPTLPTSPWPGQGPLHLLGREHGDPPPRGARAGGHPGAAEQGRHHLRGPQGRGDGPGLHRRRRAVRRVERRALVNVGFLITLIPLSDDTPLICNLRAFLPLSRRALGLGLGLGPSAEAL